MLDRGIGIFGEVTVTWGILPATLSSFVATQGQAVFSDGQPTVEVSDCCLKPNINVVILR